MTPNIISHYLTIQYVRDIEGWSGKAGQRSRITFRTSRLYAYILDSFICDIIGLTKLQESSAEAMENTIKAEASESQSNHFETFERLRRAHYRR